MRANNIGRCTGLLRAGVTEQDRHLDHLDHLRAGSVKVRGPWKSRLVGPVMVDNILATADLRAHHWAHYMPKDLRKSATFRSFEPSLMDPGAAAPYGDRQQRKPMSPLLTKSKSILPVKHRISALTSELEYAPPFCRQMSPAHEAVHSHTLPLMSKTPG